MTTPPVTPPDITPPDKEDSDGDGVFTPDDCNDDDPAVFPGATEIVADGIDQDCDNADHCYQDADSDGVGADIVVPGVELTCAVDGFAAVAGDCDDADATRWPGNRDWCDGVDNDCDNAPDPHCYELAQADTLWETPFGGFTAYPLDMAAGDFDHDGVDELAIGTILSDRIYVSDGVPPRGESLFIDSLMTEIVGADIDDCFGCTSIVAICPAMATTI